MSYLLKIGQSYKLPLSNMPKVQVIIQKHGMSYQSELHKTTSYRSKTQQMCTLSLKITQKLQIITQKYTDYTKTMSSHSKYTKRAEYYSLILTDANWKLHPLAPISHDLDWTRSTLSLSVTVN